MNKYISEFLKDVCKQIKYKKIHNDISSELMVHIDEIKDEYMSDGMTEDEAVKKAVKQMGNPIEIGENLNKTHKPKTEWSIIILISMMVIAGGLVLFYLANDIAFLNTENISIKSYLVYIGIGIITLLTLYFFDYTRLEKYSIHIFIATIAFLFLSIHFLDDMHGFPYIIIGPIGFDPMSVSIPFLLVSFSGLLIRWINGNIKDMLKVLGLAALAISINLAYKSLINTMILGLVFLVMITIAIMDKNFKGNKKSFLISIYGSLIGAVLGFLLLYIIPQNYRMEKLSAFLNPRKDPTGNGWIYVSIEKVLSGAKLLGKGDGLYFYDKGFGTRFTIPALESDFVFTYIVSSFGWIVGIAIVFIALLTIIRMFLTTKKIHSIYGKYIITSIIIVFSLQLTANMLMNLGLFPVMNIALPLISYSSTNFIVNMGLIGLLLGVYRRKDLIISSNNIKS
ncbi:rod shape-determining protein RodA [Gottschalkia purinilytica]|uniref:Rod shape-determining protein RodA n=1 Tax=Gottschalkia purinilytica TaxID=1503 RepID=A0A0L0W822_GOTPU|nr:FtsW/RodA/SpoVE family cell cycle protein [Gottschalkia purinilytica]KNF07689.1 rod shape-determining protein RodA [Gottschalkia purinilytica]